MLTEHNQCFRKNKYLLRRKSLIHSLWTYITWISKKIELVVFVHRYHSPNVFFCYELERIDKNITENVNTIEEKKGT